MEWYFPIAGLALPVWLPPLIGLAAGVVAGLFGVGGGFIVTPLLIALGVPPVIAVGTQTCQLAGSSITGAIAQWRQGRLERPVVVCLLLGGLVGVGLGLWLASALRAWGMINPVIAVGYVLVLLLFGVPVMAQALHWYRRGLGRLQDEAKTPDAGLSFWRARATDPAGPLLRPALLCIIGALGGISLALLGLGGGLITVPLMMGILGMGFAAAAANSIAQIAVLAVLATLVQAGWLHSVDVLLAVLLLLGGIIGTRLGVDLMPRLSPRRLRLLLGLVMLGLGLVLLLQMLLPGPVAHFTVLP